MGIADGFGVAEDPNGLDSEELLRLVKESLPITSFSKVIFDFLSALVPDVYNAEEWV